MLSDPPYIAWLHTRHPLAAVLEESNSGCRESTALLWGASRAVGSRRLWFVSCLDLAVFHLGLENDHGLFWGVLLLFFFKKIPFTTMILSEKHKLG